MKLDLYLPDRTWRSLQRRAEDLNTDPETLVAESIASMSLGPEQGAPRSDEYWEELKQLCDEGLSLTAMSQRLAASRTAIWRDLRQKGLRTLRQKAWDGNGARQR